MRQRWADAIGMVAVIRQAQQKPLEAHNAATEAVRAAKAADDELALARALSVLDYSLVMLGDLDSATNSHESLEIYRRNAKLDEEGQVAQNLGVYAYWRGDWASALEMYREGRETLDRVGNIVEAARADANIGEVLVNQGRFDEAEEPLFSARRIYAASGFDEGIAFVDVLIGRMYGLRGDLEQSARYLESAIDASRGLRLDAHILEASIHLADAACRSGDPQEGLAILDRAADEAPAEYVDFYSPLFARIKGSVLDAAGEEEAALSVLDEGLMEANERDDVYEAALIIETIERIDDRHLDGKSVQAARETLRTLGVRSVPGFSIVDD
jgi:tetratricopeptide (TPR) repeat protein